MKITRSKVDIELTSYEEEILIKAKEVIDNILDEFSELSEKEQKDSKFSSFEEIANAVLDSIETFLDYMAVY